MLYHDSEGGAELHFRIRGHLDLCPECAEWFARQQRFEQALAERLKEGESTPLLWERVLTGADVREKPRRRWLLRGSVLAVAAVLLVELLMLLTLPAPSRDLAEIAADQHLRLLDGRLRPDLLSNSDEEVERYLRGRVKFPVHCPPRKDANFTLNGAGVCEVQGKPAAFFVGKVDQTQVSILVLDRDSLDAFPREKNHLLQGGGRHPCREGDYQMVSGITADNVVVVIGAGELAALEKLLNAYGSYHEGT
jgi:anti-sigma factor RsiW